MTMWDMITLCQQEADCQQLQGWYIIAVHKPFITKTNTRLRVERCKNHRHCSTEMWGESEMVWSHPSNGWVRVWHTQRKPRGLNAWPQQWRAEGWFCYVVGALFWHGLGSVTHQGRVTANSEWSPLSYDHVMVCSMKMMWIKCYGLRSHQISIQLNTNVILLDT